MEDVISENLMLLNKQRIEYKNKAEYSFIYSNLFYLKMILKYIKLGNFSYAKYRIKDKFNKNEIQFNNLKPRTINKEKKIIVFTVLFGNYDNLQDPLYVSENCDYYVLANNDTVINSKIWKKFDYSSDQSKLLDGMSNLEKARFCKLHPHIFFGDSDYSIFIDANVQLVTDVRPFVETLSDNFIAIHLQPGRCCVYQEATEVLAWKKANKSAVQMQMKKYKEEGFPKDFGMYQTNVLVRDHNHKDCITLMDQWWHEIENNTKRDQLSFTYSLWKCGFSSKNVSVLGPSSYQNPRIIVHEHIV